LSKDKLNCCGDIAVFVIFKVVATAILDFQKVKILMVDPLYVANMHHNAKFHQNWSHGCRDKAI